MSRSFSNTKFLSAFVADQLSIATRRGYASITEGVVSGSKRASNVMLKKGGEEGSIATSSWVPDPKTGCYRPENHGGDTDASELRELVNKKK